MRPLTFPELRDGQRIMTQPALRGRRYQRLLLALCAVVVSQRPYNLVAADVKREAQPGPTGGASSSPWFRLGSGAFGYDYCTGSSVKTTS